MYMSEELFNAIQKSDKTIKTNIGDVPLWDYLDIIAFQNGISSIRALSDDTIRHIFERENIFFNLSKCADYELIKKNLSTNDLLLMETILDNYDLIDNRTNKQIVNPSWGSTSELKDLYGVESTEDIGQTIDEDIIKTVLLWRESMIDTEELIRSFEAQQNTLEEEIERD